MVRPNSIFIVYLKKGGWGMGGGSSPREGTQLEFSYIRRLGSFLGVQNFEFQ